MKSIPVGTRSRRYSVIVHRTPWRLGRLAPCLGGDSGRVVLISDAEVSRLHQAAAISGLGKLGLSAEPVVIPRGERAKTMATVEQIARKLVEMGAHRGTPLVAMGGGVVGDLAGLVASLYMRGVPLIHIPTTLLAQVDSSVGGKTGVNLPEGKNLLGTFYQPDRVWTCPQFLRTLPPRRVREGLAEVLKYGYIRDPDILDKACSLSPTDPCADMDLVENILVRSISVKAGVVTQDEREAGERRILNFGHTFGHALEALANFRGITHGEAVAIGMNLAFAVGEALGITEAGMRVDLEKRLRRVGLPVNVPPHITADELVDAALRDKKRSSRGVHFVFVTTPGKTRVKELESTLLRSIMKKLAKNAWKQV